jgi:cysteine desulfurase/selenocysteine lyase
MLTPESRLRDFPSLVGRVYLNTAAEGIPPLSVRDALVRYFDDKSLGMDGRIPHAATWQSVREQTGKMYGLTADEIGICSCSSEAYNLVALALQLADGDEVVINDLDFPAGATPWLQPSCPATVKVWKHRDGNLHVEDLIPLLGPKTKFVTTSLVSFFNGALVDLAPIRDAVRKHSPALFGVDVTQALGRIPLHLEDVDLIVSSTHKWILASHGGGLVGIPAKSADRWRVPAGGWFHLEDAFGAERFQKAVSKPGAIGFSVGMPNYPAMYAIDAALKYINGAGVGVEAIHAAAQPLSDLFLEEVSKLPVNLLTPRDKKQIAGIIAFRHPEADRIHKHLHAKNIHVMAHAGRLRIAIHGYNTRDDIEAILRELHAALL